MHVWYILHYRSLMKEGGVGGIALGAVGDRGIVSDLAVWV